VKLVEPRSEKILPILNNSVVQGIDDSELYYKRVNRFP